MLSGDNDVLSAAFFTKDFTCNAMRAVMTTSMRKKYLVGKKTPPPGPPAPAAALGLLDGDDDDCIETMLTRDKRLGLAKV